MLQVLLCNFCYEVSPACSTATVKSRVIEVVFNFQQLLHHTDMWPHFTINSADYYLVDKKH